MILLVPRTPQVSAQTVFLLCPGASALSQPRDLVCVCLLRYGLTCIYTLSSAQSTRGAVCLKLELIINIKSLKKPTKKNLDFVT